MDFTVTCEYFCYGQDKINQFVALKVFHHIILYMRQQSNEKKKEPTNTQEPFTLTISIGCILFSMVLTAIVIGMCPFSSLSVGTARQFTLLFNFVCCSCECIKRNTQLFTTITLHIHVSCMGLDPYLGEHWFQYVWVNSQVLFWGVFCSDCLWDYIMHVINTCVTVLP